MGGERLLVAGKWRTHEEIHAMACRSVVEDVRHHGPSFAKEIRRRQGLDELAFARAVRMCLDDGRLHRDALGRLCLRGGS